MKRNNILLIALVFCVAIGFLYVFSKGKTAFFDTISNRDFTQDQAAVAAIVKSPFAYNFTVNGTLAETGSMNESSSPFWWLNSGGRMYLKDGTGMTIQGELPENDLWRKLYSSSNPVDTDNGYHPQNIFRLVSRSKWLSYSQQIYVKITKNTLSESPERQGYSGILLFNRYQDGNNLYYAGVRDDGDVVIKSKKRGVYKTLAEKKYFSGVYNRDTNPSLLPLNSIFGIKTEISTLADNSVSIKLFLDINSTGNWEEVLSTIDRTSPILTEGYTGLRVDYKNVIFDNFKLVNIQQ